MHTALTVRAEEFLPNYRRMWDGIPEEGCERRPGQWQGLHDLLDGEPVRPGLVRPRRRERADDVPEHIARL